MKIFNNLKEKAESVGKLGLEKSKKGMKNFQKYKNKQEREDFLNDDFYDEGEPIDFSDLDKELDLDDDDIGLPPAQKPASFHHFILENQYRDIEMLIRGYKEIKDKKTQKWKIVKKENHCFTDEEAEKFVRIVQAHLSPDIKLGVIHPESYKIKMLGLGSRLFEYVETMMYYQFGRFHESEQLSMKEDAITITHTVLQRISSNYSRAISGRENKWTHDSVKGQESLQGEYSKNNDFSY